MVSIRAIAIAAVSFASVASDAAPESAKPWEQGTTQAQRDNAHQLFTAGNERFAKRDYTTALARFEQALAAFDHPRIRLAIVRTLILLGRPAEAHVHLEASLRWQQAPFDADEYAEALDHQKNLARQVGTVVIECVTAGAHLTLDGQDLVDCPGMATRIVMPGRHEVVGKKTGLLTYSELVIAEAGKQVALRVELLGLEAAAIQERRWPVWKPWVVVAGGAVVALIGAPIQLLAKSNLDEFRARVDLECGTVGCPDGLPPDVEAIESRALFENRVAISLWVVGGAAVAGGLVLAYMNRERTVIAPNAERAALVPVVGADHAGLWVVGSF